jgi:hypothetical protein
LCFWFDRSDFFWVTRFQNEWDHKRKLVIQKDLQMNEMRRNDDAMKNGSRCHIHHYNGLMFLNSRLN